MTFNKKSPSQTIDPPEFQQHLVVVGTGKFSRTYDGYNKPFETYFVATGLVPGRVYRSYVRALNLVGAGPDSDVLYRAMAVEPSAPSDLQVWGKGKPITT